MQANYDLLTNIVVNNNHESCYGCNDILENIIKINIIIY